MKGYQLLKDGEMVYTFRSTVTTLDGRQEHLTQAEVGRSGQVYTQLAQFLVDDIEAGNKEGTWKVVDLPDPDEAPSEPAQPTIAATPVPEETAPVRARRQASKSDEEE